MGSEIVLQSTFEDRGAHASVQKERGYYWFVRVSENQCRATAYVL